MDFERVAVDHRGDAGHVGQGRGGEQAYGDARARMNLQCHTPSGIEVPLPLAPRWKLGRLPISHRTKAGLHGRALQN